MTRISLTTGAAALMMATGLTTLLAQQPQPPAQPQPFSVGNALGLLPVMGQPMTFIAAATSHHMLMALPSIAIALIAGRLAAIRQLSPTSDPPPWGLWRGLTRGGL